MKVALLQIGTDLSLPIEQRVQRVAELIAAQRGADLAVLPELWATGYFAFSQYRSSAEPIGGPICQQLAAAAAAAGCYLAAGSIVEADGDAMYNASLLFSPVGELVHVYRKFHLFGHGSAETELLTHGSELATFAAPFASVALSTCYDIRFPEMFRMLVDQGAEFLVVVAAWPAVRAEHWRLLARARAVESQCFVLACNSVGTQDGTELAGHSAVIDPWGVVLAEGGGQQEEVVTAEIDPGAVTQLRQKFPVLGDRRLTIAVGGQAPAAARPRDGR